MRHHLVGWVFAFVLLLLLSVMYVVTDADHFSVSKTTPPLRSERRLQGVSFFNPFVIFNNIFDLEDLVIRPVLPENTNNVVVVSPVKSSSPRPSSSSSPLSSSPRPSSSSSSSPPSQLQQNPFKPLPPTTPRTSQGEDFPFLFDATPISNTIADIDYGVIPFTFRRFRIVDGQNKQLPIRLMLYNGTNPAPTLVVHPGQNLRFSVVNTLPPNKATPRTVGRCWPPPGVNPARLPPGLSPIGYMNNPHGFRSVNVHTHGLQTTPYQDDVYLELLPGSPARAYAFPVPLDHPTGMMWYHPHKHGAVHTHASNGASGILLVRGEMDEFMVGDSSAVRAREVLVQINHLELNHLLDSTQEGGSGSTVFGNDPIPWTCEQDGGYSPNVFQLHVILLNGKPVATAGSNKVWFPTSPTLPLLVAHPGELLWIRVANTAGSENWALGFFAGSGLVSPTEAYISDVDGISLPKLVPFSAGSQFAPGIDSRAGFMIPPSGRLGVLIRVPTRVGSILRFGHVGGAQTSPPYALFTIRVLASPPSLPGPAPGITPLSSLPGPTSRNSPIPDRDIVDRRTFALQISGFPGAPGPNPLLLTPFGFYINGKPYEETRTDVKIVVGTAQEWTIENPTSAAHNFHTHINSFQVVALLDMSVPPSQQRNQLQREVLAFPGSGYWCDVVYIPPNHKVIFRIRAVQWFGMHVAHCHILNHEEQGLMLNVDLVRPEDSVSGSPRTPGQLQRMDHGGGGSSDSNSNSNINGSVPLSSIVGGVASVENDDSSLKNNLHHNHISNNNTALINSLFTWPHPESYLYQGEEALFHPISVFTHEHR